MTRRKSHQGPKQRISDKERDHWSFSKNETIFSNSWDSDSRDGSLDSDTVTDYVENLELHGEDTLQIVDVDKYTESLGNLEPSCSILKYGEDSSDSSEVGRRNDDDNGQDYSLPHPVVNQSEDIQSDTEIILDNVKVVSQMTDEEALEYIERLKQEIRKIKLVLKTRSEKFPSKGQKSKHSKSCSSCSSNDLSEDNKYVTKGTASFQKYQTPQMLNTKRKLGKGKVSGYQNLSLDTLETMDGIDWSQFPVPGKGMRKRLERLYSKMIDSEFNYAMSLTSFKKKRKRKELFEASRLTKRTSALELFYQVRGFLQKGTSKTYTFPSMNRRLRLATHKFAEAFGIPSKSHGKEGRRSVTIYRVPYWKLPQKETIECILSQLGLKNDTKRRNTRHKLKNATFSMPTASTHSVRGRRELERSLAVDIGEDNIGHRHSMLQSMGWSKGQSLGHPYRGQAGVTQPVQVRIRPPRAGLGSGEEPS